MPIRQLSKTPGETVPKPVCRHPEHNCPPLIRLEPGTWEWRCPSCGEPMIFSVVDAQS